VAPQPQPPDLVVDIIRPADLVAMRVEAFGLGLTAGDDPTLTAGEDSGHLIVHLSFQHIAERAIYEAKVDPAIPDDDDPDPPESSTFNPPEQARPAKGSRLVFSVAAGYQIPFTTGGILHAISQLPMAVHPLARPRPVITLPPFDPNGPILGIQPGIVGLATGNGLILATETSRRRGPDPATIAGLNRLMRDRRVARAINARLGIVATRRVDVAGNTFLDRLIGGGLVFPHIPRPSLSREPRQFETAIEAPYRLVISPSDLNGWTHATAPVGAEDAEHRIELWHSRLGVRRVARDDSVTVDEASTHQRIIRAVWARDREAMADFSTELAPTHVDDPFRSSLDGADRHMLVRQSSEAWLDANNQRINPEPVEARSLYVSAIGAWLDLHGAWDTDPYSAAQMSSIESWDHIAPGRPRRTRPAHHRTPPHLRRRACAVANGHPITARRWLRSCIGRWVRRGRRLWLSAPVGDRAALSPWGHHRGASCGGFVAGDLHRWARIWLTRWWDTPMSRPTSLIGRPRSRSSRTTCRRSFAACSLAEAAAASEASSFLRRSATVSGSETLTVSSPSCASSTSSIIAMASRVRAST
jgi:hypothetical protein